MLMALLATAEILSFHPQSQRATAMCAALVESAAAAGVRAVATTNYQGGSDVLCLWGPGAPDRFGPMREQIATGGRVCAFDLAYWHRDQKVRVSIDGPHPQAWVMRHDWPADRWQRDGVALANQWRPDGPVIVAGIGAKALVQYGADRVQRWETAMVHRAKATGGEVRYRRKKGLGSAPAGLALTSDGPIETVLTGVSALITWHSNVAVDAIRMGIPVICHDGAAAAVCPSDWPAFGDPQPLPHQLRDRFLANLAWFQWAPHEVGDWWRWLPLVLA